MQLTRDRFLPLLDKHVTPLLHRKFGPAVALPIAVAAGIIVASIVNFVLEGLFSVHWWTALAYMLVFFTAAILTYRRISPQGTRLATDGGKRYLQDSGTLDLMGAAKDVRQTIAKSR